MGSVKFLMPEICSWTELKKLREDPAYNINLSDDTKRILQELGTEKGQASALLGGGGDKAQRAHALAVQAAKTRPEVEEGKEAPPPALSIVDAASAAVHGRSAEAAKASTAAKTAARVAAHAAGEIVPVNTKMVRLQFPLMTLYCSWELSASSVVWAQILCWNTFFPKIAQARNLEVAGNLDLYFQIPQFFVYAGKKQIYNWSSITVLYINIL